MQARSWIVAGCASGLVACGTDAVGVAECRDIERARCSAAVACGYPEADECRRYYRDHCLHGLPVEEVDTAGAEACVRDIQAAGACASSQGADTPPEACATPLATDGSAASICEVIRRPESSASCAFLRSADSQPPPGGEAEGT